MNCPNCGAVIKEGKFCNYCGAKLPDDTKRVEVKIDKRIEDVAEIKRADYETEESKLKQKQMKADLRARKIRRKACIIFIILFLLCFIPIFVKPGFDTFVLVIAAGTAEFFLVAYTIYLLVTGKW